MHKDVRTGTTSAFDVSTGILPTPDVSTVTLPTPDVSTGTLPTINVSTDTLLTSTANPLNTLFRFKIFFRLLLLVFHSELYFSLAFFPFRNSLSHIPYTKGTVHPTTSQL